VEYTFILYELNIIINRYILVHIIHILCYTYILYYINVKRHIKSKTYSIKSVLSNLVIRNKSVVCIMYILYL